MEHHELIQQLRGQLVRGVVGAVDDTGDVQTVDLMTHDGVGRSSVEVQQPYGLASVPPDAQPGTIVLAIGGDQGHQVALHLTSAYRFGKLAPGEVALFDWGGNRLHLKVDGNGDLMVAALLTLAAKTLMVKAPDGCTFLGPVTFAAPVTFTMAATFESDVAIAGNLTVGGNVTAKGHVAGG